MSTAVGLRSIAAALPGRSFSAMAYAYLMPQAMALSPRPAPFSATDEKPATPGEQAENTPAFCAPAQRRRAVGDDAVDDLGAEAARLAIEKAGLSADAISFVIAGSIGGNDTIATWVHHVLQLPETSPAQALIDTSASFVNGLYYASRLVKTGDYPNVLVVAATAWDAMGDGPLDPTSPSALPAGDGATAAVVSAENIKAEILAYQSQTYGEVYDAIQCRYRERLQPALSPLVPTGSSQVRAGNYIDMDERAFHWFLDSGPGAAREGLSAVAASAGIKVADIRYVLHNQLGNLSRTWPAAATQLGLAKSAWYETFNSYGDVGNATVGINLSQLADDGALAPGDLVAMFVMAAGGQAPTILLRWV